MLHGKTYHNNRSHLKLKHSDFDGKNLHVLEVKCKRGLSSPS